MAHTLRLIRAILLSILIALILPSLARAQASPTPIPDGFSLVSTAPGVSLYRKDYPGGSPDFVQIIELNSGARIVAMHGEIHERRPGRGAYGGDDARIMSQSLEKFWEQLSNISGNRFCVLNGQFFYMKESPTRLPFPLKVSDEIISDGYGINEFPDKKLILEIWSDRANIQELTQDSLYFSTAPDIIGGLMQTANKRSDHYVGRTFIGTDDRDQDGTHEIFLIFNSQISRQVDAANVLHAFGADKVMMLDGGGSTQLICQDETLIKSDRPIPQAIGVVSAPHGQPEILQPVSTSEEPDEGNAPKSNPSTGEDTNSISQQAILNEQREETIKAAFTLGDVLWVPLIMSPVLVVLVFFVIRLRE